MVGAATRLVSVLLVSAALLFIDGHPARGGEEAPGCANGPLPVPPAQVELDRLLHSGAGAAAVPGLCAALAEAEGQGDARRVVSLQGSLGIALLAGGQVMPARAVLERSIAGAVAGGWPDLEALGRLNLGNALLAREAQPVAALAAYERSRSVAERTGRPGLAVRAMLGEARAQWLAGAEGPAIERARAAARAIGGLPVSRALSIDGVAAGELLLPSAPGEAAEIAAGVAARAAAQGWVAEEAVALTLLSRAEAGRGRRDAALAAAQAAQARALVADAPQTLFRAQRQSGALLRDLGRPAEALAAYRGAVAATQRLGQELRAADPWTGGSFFRDEVGPFYMELVELLLMAAETAGDKARAGRFLTELRAVLERLRTAELEDYFEDDCVAELRSLTRAVEMVAPPATAVLYPIVLPGRLVLLVSTPGQGLVIRSQTVTRDEVTRTAHALRYQLEARTSRRYLPLAQRLHAWLIGPVTSALPVDLATLVVIPDGALRGIPFGALHDGQQFLVERFAIATAPGLTLLDSRMLQGRSERPLLTGLSLPRQGFTALPHVRDELGQLQQLLGGELLVDATFERVRLERSFARTSFTIVHIASHGEFGGDPSRSFLLTYDGRLDMNELERLLKPARGRDEPVELITLSACQTAAGDDRAALGLAGIAVKAGARSALASLWSIQDESAALLMRAFYGELAAGAVSKAQALRRAQLAMLADARYRHPAYWAAFMLIGNWT